MKYILHGLHLTVFKILYVILKSLVFFLYNIRVHGKHHYKDAGDKCLIIANHSSFIDGLILYLFLPKKAAFAIAVDQFKTPKVRFLSKFIKFFPVNQSEPHSLKSLIKQLNESEDQHIIIFPEGRLTGTGGLMKVYDGTSLIIEKTKVNVLPIYIKNAEHTIFSRVRNYTGVNFPIVSLHVLAPEKIEAPAGYSTRQRREYFPSRIYDIMKTMKYKAHNTQHSLIEAIEDAAKINGPKKVILSDSLDMQLTYKQLINRAKHICKHLRLSLSEEKRNIGLLMPNSTATSLIFWGILYANKTPAMMNIELGFKALLQQARMAGVNVIYTSKMYIHVNKAQPIIKEIRENGIEVRYVEDLRKIFKFKTFLKINLRALFLPKTKSTKDYDATILFTTSSRNKYKGLVLNHKNILANVQQVLTVWELNETDKMVNVIPNYHSFGLIMGTIMPVIKGISSFQHPNPLQSKIVAEICYQTSATVLVGTDSLLYRYGLVAHNYDFFKLRYVWTGGEHLRATTQQLWMDKFGIRILEAYVNSEATCVISMNTPMENKLQTVGRLLPGITHKLEPTKSKDDDKHTLSITGDNVVRTYMYEGNRTSLTQEPWYTTPDFVTEDHEGYLKIIGRQKRFAKIAGQRVSIDAVEDFIHSLYPKDQHCVIHMQDDDRERLGLLTTCDHIDLANVRKKSIDAGYSNLFAPHISKHVKDIPLKSNGKVDYSEVKKILKNVS